MGGLRAIYDHLPPKARSLAGSVRGYSLLWWRYGPETEKLAAEALGRESWSPSRWKKWQEERLGEILQRAATRVPYYREQWAERRRKGDDTQWSRIENWPVLKKDALRPDPRAFLADGCRTWTMFSEHTSGTTGTPIHLWRSRSTVRGWYALCEARWHRWYGLTRDDRWANIGGQLVAPIAQRKPPFWIWNAPMHQLYMSSYHLAGDLASFYLDALERYRVEYIMGYTSSLHALATAAMEQKRRLRMEAVLTNAEPLYAHQRELMSEVFQCPVRETYGMAEMVVAASECTAGKLHLWSDAGITEVLDWQSDQPVAPGNVGRIVATGLLDPDMPLVRYETGDSGALDPDEGPCECGRTLPRLLRVEGRNDDILWTRDGRRVGRLDPVFKAGLNIREAQIVQQSLDRVIVRLVPADGYSEADERLITRQLKDRLGNVTVGFETLDRIPREPNGKFRAVVCRLSSDEKRGLLHPGNRHVVDVPERPAATVILPVRNEAACIGRALAAVLGQDYPKDRLEIIVVDGMSTDGTRQIVERFVRRYSEVEPQRTQRQQRPDANSQLRLADQVSDIQPQRTQSIGESGAEPRPSLGSVPSVASVVDQGSDIQPQRTQSIGESGAEPRLPPDTERSVRSVADCPVSIRLLENLDRVAPCALNIGIRAARGDIIIRVDGHCEIASDFITRCVEHILKDGVDGVGGPVQTVGETNTADAIAAAMSSRFGVGDSAFRTAPGKTGLVDTVPFPAYTRSIIRQAGGYDEELVRCQDDEYNYRLLDLGARILLAGDVHSRYYSRGTLCSLWTQYFRYGYWKVRVMQKHPKQMRLRQFVPPSFVLSLLIVLSLWSIVPGSWVGVAAVGGSYVVANLAASVLTASKKGWRYVLLLPVVYAILHLSYGLGFLVGLLKFWNRWSDKKGRVPEFKPREAEGA